MAYADEVKRRTWELAYYRKHRERILARNRERRATDKKAFQATKLRFRYGITYEQYEALFKAQRGLCALCGKRPAADVDHDHKTHIVRGLLCRACNVGLGLFREDAQLLLKAISYLRTGTELAKSKLLPIAKTCVIGSKQLPLDFD